MYQTILGLQQPWTVGRVAPRGAMVEIDVWAGAVSGTIFQCPRCGAPAPIHDHVERWAEASARIALRVERLAIAWLQAANPSAGDWFDAPLLPSRSSASMKRAFSGAIDT